MWDSLLVMKYRCFSLAEVSIRFDSYGKVMSATRDTNSDNNDKSPNSDNNLNNSTVEPLGLHHAP